MKWKGKLISFIIEQLKEDAQWESILGQVLLDNSIGIHLAVFNEPFLSLIYKGIKTIESRFSINNISPYARVKKGDIILLKESGGFINGFFIAGDIKYYRNLNDLLKEEIETQYGEKICTSFDKNFWNKQEEAKYATLIEIEKFKITNSFKCDKNDRSGWSIIREGIPDSLFSQKEVKIKTVVTLSGRICSGKSHIAQKIKVMNEIPIASFGHYLKECCENNNLPTERKTLQEIGEILIRINPRQFLLEVISQYTTYRDVLVLDGVRHRTIFDQVKSIAENHVSIFVDADINTRYERYKNRGKESDNSITFDEFVLMDNHTVELEIMSLKPLCDIIVESSYENLDEVLEKQIKYIK